MTRVSRSSHWYDNMREWSYTYEVDPRVADEPDRFGSFLCSL